MADNDNERMSKGMEFTPFLSVHFRDYQMMTRGNEVISRMPLHFKYSLTSQNYERERVRKEESIYRSSIIVTKFARNLWQSLLDRTRIEFYFH